MRSTDQLVIAIESAVANSAIHKSPETKRLAEEYAETSIKVSKRVDQCIQFARKGFRSEAVRLSNLPPSVFEEISRLDFPMRKQWMKICESFGIVVPRLPLEKLDELYAEIESYEKVEEHINFYRKLNVFRRSMESRVQLLRRLRGLESDRTEWIENLKRLNVK
jgi:hypothetical protein